MLEILGTELQKAGNVSVPWSPGTLQVAMQCGGYRMSREECQGI